MDQVTLSWLTLSITDSPLSIALLHACRFLTLLVFRLFGGALADRLDRRVMLIRTQPVSMIVTLGLAAGEFRLHWWAWPPSASPSFSLWRLGCPRFGRLA